MNQQSQQQQQHNGVNVPQYIPTNGINHSQNNKLQLAPLGQERQNSNASAGKAPQNDNLYGANYGRPLTNAFFAGQQHNNIGTMMPNGGRIGSTTNAINQPSADAEPLGLYKKQTSTTLQHQNVRNQGNLAAPILSHSVGSAASSNAIQTGATTQNGPMHTQAQITSKDGSYLSPLKRPRPLGGQNLNSSQTINTAQGQQFQGQIASRQQMIEVNSDEPNYLKNNRTFCYSNEPNSAVPSNSGQNRNMQVQNQNQFAQPQTTSAAGQSQEQFGTEKRPRRLTSHKGQANPNPQPAQHEIRDSAVLVAGGYGVTTINSNADHFQAALLQNGHHSHTSQQQKTATQKSAGQDVSTTNLVQTGRLDSRKFGNQIQPNAQQTMLMASSHKTNSSMDMRPRHNSAKEDNDMQQNVQQHQVVPRSQHSKERLNAMRTSVGNAQQQDMAMYQQKILNSTGSVTNKNNFEQSGLVQSLRDSSGINPQNSEWIRSDQQKDGQLIQSSSSSRPRNQSSVSHQIENRIKVPDSRLPNDLASERIETTTNVTNDNLQLQIKAQEKDSSKDQAKKDEQKSSQPKIPVICGFHKQMLLLTCQYFTSAHHNNPNLNPNTSASVQGSSLYSNSASGGPFGFGGNPNSGFTGIQPNAQNMQTNPFPGPQPQPQSIQMTGNPNSTGGQSQIKRIRNKNPNCNHNSSSVFYQPQFNNVKFDESHRKKEDVLRKVFFKEASKEEQKRQEPLPANQMPAQFNNSNMPAGIKFDSLGGGVGGRHSATLAAGSQIMKPSRNDPYTLLKIVDHVLSDLMYNKEPIDRTKPLSSAQTVLLELELQAVHSAHKAFLLALIRSGKVNIENLYRVLAEVKHSGALVDSQCIYCKYSQFALKESTKIQLRQEQAAAAEAQNAGQNGETQPFGSPVSKQDQRIEHLVKMFQTQLFKKSFITTSLLIIQRRMNEKYIFRQRQNQPNNAVQSTLNTQPSTTTTLKRPVKEVPKKPKEVPPKPANILESIALQIQKLGKNLANPKDKEKLMELKEKYYREFLMKIQRSNNNEIKFPTGSFPPYKYYIGKGNNSILVRAALKTRFWWSMGDFEHWDDYNFLWTQWRSHRILDTIKPYKKPETEEQRATSSAKSESLLSTQPTDKDSSSSVENLITTPKRQQKVALMRKANSMNPSTAPSSSVQTSGNKGVRGKKDEKEEKEDNPTQHSTMCTNHQDSNFHLSNKKAIYYNMKVYYESTGQNTFDYLPLTYHITEGVQSKEFEKFANILENPETSPDLRRNPSSGTHLWIVKPGENTNQGCGINVCRDLQSIKGIINNAAQSGKKRSFIIQKYIERPLLYKGRKFDIRAYMLTVTTNGNFQGYWYQDGYLRTCCKEFSLNNVTNRLVHLTNDAVQKRAADYGRFESGNKLSYNEFQKYLDGNNSKLDFIKTCVPAMKKLGTDTIKAISRKLDATRKQCTFEIFGYDFMIDETFKPWLLEVNTNPNLELSAPYLARLIPAMIENALKIAVDPIFPPPPVPVTKRHAIPDALDNRFELVFNERDDAAELKNLPIDDTINGIIEEDELEDQETEEEEEDENHP